MKKKISFLNRHRLLQGLSQDEVSARTGHEISPSRLSRIERGLAIPREDQKRVIAKALGEPVKEVFPEDEMSTEQIDEITGGGFLIYSIDEKYPDMAYLAAISKRIEDLDAALERSVWPENTVTVIEVGSFLELFG